MTQPVRKLRDLGLDVAKGLIQPLPLRGGGRGQLRGREQVGTGGGGRVDARSFECLDVALQHQNKES